MKLFQLGFLILAFINLLIYRGVLGQTLTSENTDNENISFSELSKTDASAGTVDETKVEYGPWGCKFTVSPFDASCGKEKIVPPPPDVIKEQAEILNFLRGRKESLDQRESMIMGREKELSDLEQRVEQKINEIKKINDTIQQERQNRAKEDSVALKQLVSYYEKIPPENAAVFFNQMDIQTTTMILTRMNPRKSAALLAALDPKVAINITEYIAKIKNNREEYLTLPNYSGTATNNN